jgi:hypothetical protein
MERTDGVGNDDGLREYLVISDGWDRYLSGVNEVERRSTHAMAI